MGKRVEKCNELAILILQSRSIIQLSSKDGNPSPNMLSNACNTIDILVPKYYSLEEDYKVLY